MTRSYYLIGAPGSGKSATMGKLLRPWRVGRPYSYGQQCPLSLHPLAQDALVLRGAYLGKIKPEHSGTDALPKAVQPTAVEWLRQSDGDLDYIYGEGARLGNPEFLSELALRSRLTVVLLTASPGALALRLSKRAPVGSYVDRRQGTAPAWQEGCAQRARRCAEALLALVPSTPNLEVLAIDTTDKTPNHVALEIVGAIER